MFRNLRQRVGWLFHSLGAREMLRHRDSAFRLRGRKRNFTLPIGIRFAPSIPLLAMHTVHPPNRLNVFFRTLRALLLGAAFSVPLLAQSTGIVAGQVSNAATSAFLEGADVSVEGSSRSALTDREGRFELVLPPGVATLVVRYTGLEPQTVTVDVKPGARTVQNIDMSSGVYKLDPFTVSGPREGSAYAITRQREAPNVKNVVASDSFGNIADGNIGDFLQQLPGITAVYVGADVRSVQIRGLAPSLNSVTMNGDRIASAPSDQSSRTFEFEQASLGLIETIEVIKAPTPDMDADSIGGAVNLIPKSSFDRMQKRFFSYSLGGVWRPKYQTNSREFLREPITDIGPSLNLTYADRFGRSENIGVVLTGTYHSQPGGDTAALMNYGPTLENTWISSVTAP